MRWVAIGSLFWLFGCGEQRTENGSSLPCLPDSVLSVVGLAPAQVEPVPVELMVPGEVVPVPSFSVDVRAGVAGRVSEVYVQVGQEVARGAPLLRIRSPQLLEWEAQYRSAQAQLKAQQLKVQALERLKQDSLLSLTEWQSAQAELASLAAQVEQLAEQLRLFQPVGAEFLVLAPRAGTVTHVAVSAGTTIEESQELLRIADLSQVRLQVYLYSEQLLQARVGMEGKAFFSGLEEPISFRLMGIQPVLEEETRAAVGYADLPNQTLRLRPGAFFLGRLRLLREDSAVALPLSALVLDADRRYAILYRSPCTWEVRPVQLIRQASGKAYIQGIQPGETLATQKVLFLYEQLTRAL